MQKIEEKEAVKKESFSDWRTWKSRNEDEQSPREESSDTWRRRPVCETIVVQDPYQDYIRHPIGNIVGRRSLLIKKMANNPRRKGQANTTMSEVNEYQGGSCQRKYRAMMRCK